MNPVDKIIAEFNSMEERRVQIYLAAFENYPHNLEKTNRVHGHELNINKERMEHWLSQLNQLNGAIITEGYVIYLGTEFKPKLLRALIKTEQILSDGDSDDYGRYTTMGMQIDPEDEEFNRRKVE